MSRCRFDKNRLREILEDRVKSDNIIQVILSRYPDDYRCEREAYRSRRYAIKEFYHLIL